MPCVYTAFMAKTVPFLADVQPVRSKYVDLSGQVQSSERSRPAGCSHTLSFACRKVPQNIAPNCPERAGAVLLGWRTCLCVLSNSSMLTPPGLCTACRPFRSLLRLGPQLNRRQKPHVLPWVDLRAVGEPCSGGVAVPAPAAPWSDSGAVGGTAALCALRHWAAGRYSGSHKGPGWPTAQQDNMMGAWPMCSCHVICRAAAAETVAVLRAHTQVLAQQCKQISANLTSHEYFNSHRLVAAHLATSGAIFCTLARITPVCSARRPCTR